MRGHHSISAALGRRAVLTIGASVAAWFVSFASAADLHVTVLTAAGERVDGATVCAGTSENPSQYGTTTTNFDGIATLRSVPTGLVHVTAHRLDHGVQVTHQMGSAQQSIAIRLPVAPTSRACGAAAAGGLNAPPHIDPRAASIALPNVRLQPSAPPLVSLKEEYCFGALGAQCGGAQMGIPLAALCAAGYCRINAGSWEHDECCWAHPRGMACQVGPLDHVLGHDGHCVAEWNKALSRLQAGLNWARQVDFNKPNRTGRVVFSDYCAPAGSRVHQDDVRYCCSRQADRMPWLPAQQRVCQ
jgi:hypothetical protein